MTVEEKAKEIYFSMLNAGKGMISDYLAQQCALICVDEIIECTCKEETCKKGLTCGDEKQ